MVAPSMNKLMGIIDDHESLSKGGDFKGPLLIEDELFGSIVIEVQEE
jgi:hypothetical protein